MLYRIPIRPLLILGLAGLVTLISTAALTAPATPGGGHMIQRGIERFLNDPEVREAADISDEQVAEIEAITYEARRTGIELRSQAQLAELEQEQLWAADEPDSEAIHEAIDSEMEIETAQRHAQADTRLRVQSVLSVEQRDAIRATLQERMEERREQRQERGGAAQGERIRQRFQDQGPGQRGPQRGARSDFGLQQRRGPMGQIGPQGSEQGGPAPLAFAGPPTPEKSEMKP
jgi:Spy/CpxP family protein refolding chaperone